MSKATLTTIIAILAAALAGYIIWAATRPQLLPAGGPEQPSPTGTATAAKPQTYGVEIKNFTFAPANLRIKSGDTVKWENFDSVRHSVSSTFSDLNSELLSVGETFKYTFKNAGAYDYDCGPHPNMKGKIIVE